MIAIYGYVGDCMRLGHLNYAPSLTMNCRSPNCVSLPFHTTERLVGWRGVQLFIGLSKGDGEATRYVVDGRNPFCRDGLEDFQPVKARLYADHCSADVRTPSTEKSAPTQSGELNS